MVEAAGSQETSFYVANREDGVRLHCLRWGQGPRVIIGVHGLNAHGYHWRRTAERLGPEYSLVAFDLRGHGDSDKPPTGYTYDDSSRDIDAIVRCVAERAEDVVIIGHSLGARVAMPWVIEHRPRGFVAVDPGIVAHHEGPPPPRNPRRRPLVMEYDSSEAFMERMQHTDFLRNWTPYAEEYAARLIEPAGHDRSVRLKLMPWALRQTMEAITGVDLTLGFPQIACPTLVIRATEGHLQQAMAERMRDEIPGGELVVIDGANHNVMLDAPEAFDAALDPFLARLFA